MRLVLEMLELLEVQMNGVQTSAAGTEPSGAERSLQRFVQ